MGRLFLTDNVQQHILEIDPSGFATINGPVSDANAHTIGGMLNRLFTGVGAVIRELNPRC